MEKVSLEERYNEIAKILKPDSVDRHFFYLGALSYHKIMYQLSTDPLTQDEFNSAIEAIMNELKNEFPNEDLEIDK